MSPLIVAFAIAVSGYPQESIGSAQQNYVTRMAELEPLKRVAHELFNNAEYEACMKYCEKFMLEDIYSKGVLGPLAIESAMRIKKYNFVSLYAKDLGLQEGSENKCVMTLVLLKKQGFDVARKVSLPPTAVDSFVKEENMTKLLLPANSSAKLEFLLLLKISDKTRDRVGKLLYNQQASQVLKNNAIPHLRNADLRWDSQANKKDWPKIEVDFAKAWKLGPEVVRTFVRRKVTKAQLYRVSGGKEGQPPAL